MEKFYKSSIHELILTSYANLFPDMYNIGDH